MPHIPRDQSLEVGVTYNAFHRRPLLPLAMFRLPNTDILDTRLLRHHFNIVNMLLHIPIMVLLGDVKRC